MVKTKSLRHSIATIATGALAGQLVGGVAYLILPRLYSPGDIALFATFSSICAILGTIAAGRYELAIPLPEKNGEAARLAVLGLTLSAATAIATTFAVLLFYGEVNRLLGGSAPGRWLLLTPIATAFYGGYLVFSQWAIRLGDFGAIARRNIIQPISMVTVQLGSGMAGFRPGGLPTGYATAQIASTLSLAARRPRVWEWKSAELPSLWATAKKYRRCPLILAPSGLLNIAATQGPILLFAVGYSATATGNMGFTQRALVLPVALIGVAVAQVYLSTAARAHRDGEDISSLYRAVSVRLLIAGCLIMAPLLVAGPSLFDTVFGSDYEQAGHFARALSIGMAAQLLGSPLSQTLIIFGRFRLQLACDGLFFLMVNGVLALCIITDRSPQTAAWAMSGAASVAFVAAWLASYRTILSNKTG